MLLKNLYT